MNRTTLRLCSILLMMCMLFGCSLSGCGKQELGPSLADLTQAPTAETEKPRETAHIHVYETTVTEPTCTTDGYTEYRCVCGDVRVGAAAETAGHSYLEEIVPPTIAAEGYTIHTCEVCGESFQDSFVDMLPDGIEDGTFFDDAAFVGDSIVLSMRTHAQLSGCFGNAMFLCRASFSIRSAAQHSMGLTYRGGSYTVAEALAACGAKKVFMQLGMNDIATFTADQSMEFWATVITEIRELNPDILIFIQTGTPIYDERGALNNENMDQYNEDLKALAAEMDCFFVDIATPMKDENGFLRSEYCSDAYCHLSIEGAAVWERALKDFLLEHKGEFA